MPSGPEHRRQYRRKYYQDHREEILEQRRENREHLLAYQRDWYRKNREAHMAKAHERQRTKYAGRCVVCGAVTTGKSKAKPGSRFCRDHKKEQWEEKTGKRTFLAVFVEDEESVYKHSEEQREAWREAQRKRRAKLREATPDVQESKKQSDSKTAQDRLERSSRRSPSFSRLKHSEGRVRVWRSGNPPADSEEGNP